jgi:hypothetical protein
VDTRYTHVVDYLTRAGIIKPAANEIETRAVLVIPSSSSSELNDSPIFKVAMAQSSGRYSGDLFQGSESKTGTMLTYVNLTHDEMIQVLSYVSQKGISQEPLMTLVLENIMGNLLVQAQYADEVNAIIAGKPRLTAMNTYSLFNTTPTK